MSRPKYVKNRQPPANDSEVYDSHATWSAISSLDCTASSTSPRMLVPFSGRSVRNRFSLPRPMNGTKGVSGVVVVQLNVCVKRRVMLVSVSGRVSEICGGSVALALGVTEMLPFDTTSNVRYCTVVPLIQFRTSVIEDAFVSPSVQLKIELKTVPPDST